MNNNEIRRQEREAMRKMLDELGDQLVDRVTRLEGIFEGRVMTVGPPPYRRLDGRGRALAYVRTRPRKKAVRVDVSGLWCAGPPSGLEIRTSTGARCLLLRSAADVDEAVSYLREVYLRTKVAEDAEEAQREARASRTAAFESSPARAA